MLPIGLNISNFKPIKRLIFELKEFNFEEEEDRDSKIFGIIRKQRKTIRNKSRQKTTKKNKNKL
jgi:hypothetical protein